MKDEKLYDTSYKYSDIAKRNIIFDSNPSDAFSSIIDDDEDLDILNLARSNARETAEHEGENEDFYYTAAIDYPFSTRPFMSSRFSDGSFPIWYGSVEIETSIFETAYHALKYILAEEGTERESSIIKKRAVFDVYCEAILLDLRNKEKKYPKICAEDHIYTQEIGKESRKLKLPGIISPSTRMKGGSNINILEKDVLSDPELNSHLKYIINPKKKLVQITGLEEPFEIQF